MSDIVERLRAPVWNASIRWEAADEIERLRAALTEINSQAVCAVLATEGECFQMLQNCAEISDRALQRVPNSFPESA